MQDLRNQHTLARPCQVSGRGYWSSQPITLTFMPAAANTGIRFVRTDLPGFPAVEAIADYRLDMPLRTRLAKGDAVVDMVEHVMAALYGLKIDNCEIHCTGCEMPGLDGSSHAYVLELEAAGQTVQSAMRAVHVISQPIRVGSDQQWVAAFPLRSQLDAPLTVEYQLDYGPTSVIGSATYTCPVNEFTFVNELASARTFLTASEAQQLQRKGLAQHVTTRDLLVFGDDGPIDNQLRYPDECPRHKALDLLGDLALSGLDLVGTIVAHRSGHQLNGRMASTLRLEFERQLALAAAPQNDQHQINSTPPSERRVA